MNKDIEIRNIISSINCKDEESRTITGLAIPVESRSELLGRTNKFYETIRSAAINDELIASQDIKLYLNHDESQGTYARSKYGNGSLKLFITERGLEFETELPNTAFGDQLLEGIRRGDYDSMSFAFVPSQDKWSKNADGTYERSIESIGLITEISCLSCTPAYSATEVNTRSLDEFIEEENAIEEKRKQEILERLEGTRQEILEACKIDE